MNPITPEPHKPQDTGEENMTTRDKQNIEATILTAMETGEKKVFMKLLLELHRAGEQDFMLSILNKHWDKQKQRDAYREKIGTR